MLVADYYSFFMPVIRQKITDLTVIQQNKYKNKGCSKVAFAYSVHVVEMLSCYGFYCSITSILGSLWGYLPHTVDYATLNYLFCSFRSFT